MPSASRPPAPAGVPDDAPTLLDGIAALRASLGRAADPDRAPAMRAYMKDHFEFLGITSADRRRAAKSFVAAGRRASSEELFDAADALWAEPEREFQYVGCDLLRRWVGRLDGLQRLEPLIRTKSWWDTIDTLASHVAGPLVRADDARIATMDAWIDDSDMWIARTAILHQLSAREDTDADRLFRYVDRRCGDSEFFVRKACGWALRQYAKVDPDAVRGYVDSRGDRLSTLTRREATKHL